MRWARLELGAASQIDESTTRQAYIDIGGSEELELKGALLVYQGKSRGFVTWHEARKANAGGAPFLGEAQELTTEFVHQLAQGLGTDVATEILPENILVRTAETITWWTPEKVQTMFFAPGDDEAHRLNGRRFPQPPLESERQRPVGSGAC